MSCLFPVKDSAFPANQSYQTNRKKKPSASRLQRDQQQPPTGTPSPANKLEELLPPVLHPLTPSNLKKTASNFMKEWEKSLSPPPQEAGGS